MENLKKFLEDNLSRANKIAILGVGSEIRGDDAAGMLAAEALDSLLKDKIKDEKVKVFYGKTCPENLTGDIRRFGPTHIVIIDSADMGREPGSISPIAEDKISAGSFSTHRMPLNMLLTYLRSSLNCAIFVIGIQPENIGLNQPPSDKVREAVKELGRIIAVAAAGI